MLQFTISPRVAAAVLVRLRTRALSDLARAAARHEATFRRIFLTAVRKAQASVPMSDLVDVLSLGHSGTGAPLYLLEPIIDAFLEPTQLTVEHRPYVRAAETRRKPLREAYVDTMKAGANSQTLIDMSFDATNPEAIAWAEKRAAKLVTDVTKDVRVAIRIAVVEGLENGIAPINTARAIRSVLGLTERDASAVMKRQIELMQAGVSTKDASDRAERYAAKLTRARALTIARTETMSAANEGQLQLWEQAIEAGLLTGREQKVWMTADPCPICEAIEEAGPVGIDEDFETEEGSFSGPPAHPNCRCSVGLVE
jgi:hypothetical protein